MRRAIVVALMWTTSVATAQRSTDPAGVRVIRYPVVPPTAVVALTTPSLTLPQDNCELNRVSSIVMQSSGGIVIANGGNVELCRFDARGQFVKKIGRRGSGPGEFVSIAHVLSYRGDSIAVTDNRQRRVSIFGPNGETGREFLIAAPDSGLGTPTFAETLTDGTLLLGFSEFVSGPPRPDAVVFSQRIFHTSATGASLERVGSFPSTEHFIQAAPPEMGGAAYWSLAFGRAFTAATLGNEFVGGNGTDGAVRQYDARGKLRGIHQLGIDRAPVTAEIIASYREVALKSARPERRASEERRVGDMPFPKQYPAYSRVLSEDGTRIWIQPYPVGTTSHWIRVDPSSGKAQGFSFPARFRLFGVRDGRACGVGRDDVDLETVYCFALPR